MENQNSAEIMGGGELFSQAWSIYKNKWKTYLPIMVIPFIVSIAGNIFSAKAEQLGEGYFISWVQTNFTLFLLYMVLFIVLLVVTSLSQLALVYSVKSSVTSDSGQTFKESYDLALKNLLSSWWVTFLLGVIVIGGFILLIIPGILFAVWYGFALVVLVDQGLKGMEALRTSKGYVKGRWWKVFWRSVFIVIVMLVSSLIYSLILGTLFSEMVTNFVLTPVVTLYYFLLYKNLKDTKLAETIKDDAPQVV